MIIIRMTESEADEIVSALSGVWIKQGSILLDLCKTLRSAAGLSCSEKTEGADRGGE